MEQEDIEKKDETDIEEAASRLAEIFLIQLQSQKRSVNYKQNLKPRKKKSYGKKSM
jgi:hypothetical protein